MFAFALCARILNDFVYTTNHKMRPAALRNKNETTTKIKSKKPQFQVDQATELATCTEAGVVVVFYSTVCILI